MLKGKQLNKLPDKELLSLLGSIRSCRQIDENFYEQTYLAARKIEREIFRKKDKMAKFQVE